MEVLACPGCGSDQFKIVGRVGSAFDATAGRNVFSQPEYRVKLCSVCGLYYKSHIIDIDALTLYYNQVDFSKWETDGVFPSERALLEELSKLPTGSRILDYGCSSGRLLSNLTGRYECFGVEIHQGAAKVAEGRGIKIVAEEVIDLHGPFEAVVLCDVFEHLPHPTHTLSVLCRALNLSGMLLLCTGNADAKACRKDVANFWYFRTLEHLSMLGRSYVGYLAAGLGLELIAWKEVSHYKKDFLEKARQKVKNFLYWQFNENPHSYLSAALGLVPVARKAKAWQHLPALDYTRDHVVAVLKKLPAAGDS